METTNGSLNRKLRMALVGGGQGAFIGAIVFPLLAIGFEWAAVRSWQRGGRGRAPAA